MRALLRIEAMSLDLPAALDHPNRMPFSGILTRVGSASDKPPHGTGGKRILLTHEAAEEAIPSLLGMGVDLTADLDGHNAQSKIGVITAARIKGDAILVEGFIYAADFPREALRVHLNAADLGFSFEAQNLTVESKDADPLIVKKLVFTGAAILMKDSAAYQTTALAAAAAKDHEMSERNTFIYAPVPASAIGTSVHAAADTHQLPGLAASVARQIQRVSASAGVGAPKDRGCFTKEQMNRMLEGKRVEDRISIKNLLLSAGLYPRDA